MNGTTTSCSQCGAPFEIGDEFCEACGGSLTSHDTAAAQAAPLAVLPKVSPGTDTATSPPQAGSSLPAPDAGAEAGIAPTAETARTVLASSVCACGGRIADDGYCEECGAKGRSERDHWTEQPVTWVGGACDRGVRHHRNEDAMAMVAQPEPGSFGALIVCDGVSTASNSDAASLAAARAARDIIAASVRPTSTTISARITHWTGVLEAAAAAGNAEVCSTEATELGPERSAPACTFVAAIVDRDLITVGWVGDSRAYWFPDDGVPQALSIDHSVASDDIARGVARSVAESGNMAHAITRWFGDDTPTGTGHGRG